MAIFSRASGPGCYMREDYPNIAAEGTAGFEMNTGDPHCGGGCSEDPGGDVTDVIFENVGIYDFTYGIKAVSEITSEHKISGVKLPADTGLSTITGNCISTLHLRTTGTFKTLTSHSWPEARVGLRS